MPKANPQQPLVVICDLCRERIPSTRARCWYAACDHGFDEHPDHMRLPVDRIRKLFRYTNPASGRPARLTPTAPRAR